MTEIISGENLDQKAVDIIAQAINELLKDQDQVVLAIPGGRSVWGIFSLLAQEKSIPWNKVHIFMVDERLVPIDNDQSNFKLANELFIGSLVERKLLPQINVHPFIFDPKKSNSGLADYEQGLKQLGGKYDIILLGVGEDGHVGALFPDHQSVNNSTEYFLTMDDSPKPPPKRMTASKQLLAKAQYAIALFLGQAKKQALENYGNESLAIENCPAKIIDEIENSYLITDLK